MITSIFFFGFSKKKTTSVSNRNVDRSGGIHFAIQPRNQLGSLGGGDIGDLGSRTLSSFRTRIFSINEKRGVCERESKRERKAVRRSPQEREKARETAAAAAQSSLALVLKSERERETGGKRSTWL